MPAAADEKAVAKDEPKKPLTTRIWEKTKHEAAHYYHGSKLLVSEVRISSRLLLKLMRGGNLTRRENRQVQRTIYPLEALADEFSAAETHNHRSLEVDSVLGLHRGAVYGASPTRRDQALPEHASEYIRGQVCSCE